MTPQAFRAEWTKNGENLFPIAPERLEGLKLQKETIDFLSQAGLPEEASPYLTFVDDTEDLYEGIQRLTDQHDDLDPKFDKYIAIGYDGSGNTLAVNTAQADRVEWLDHDDDFSSKYVNSSIGMLAEFLVYYKDFVETILAENGDDAYLDADFTDAQFEVMKQKMVAADKKAVSGSSFWKDELETLLANRADNFAD